MAIAVPDTSFLFALYGHDAHTAAARAWMQQAQVPLTLTPLHRYELGNALRFAVFRKVIAPAEAAASLASIEADLAAGFLQLAPTDLAALVAEAQRLSEAHTITGGHRSFDILHVAAAVSLHATTFLSFDQNQRRLAAAVGLAVGP